MRFRHAMKTIGAGIRLLFTPRASLLPEICREEIRRSILKDIVVMPDFSTWTDRNHIDIYLSQKDYFQLGGLKGELLRSLEQSAVQVCKNSKIKNPYGRFELSLGWHPELKYGEVFVESSVDSSLPTLAADHQNEAPMQFRTIYMKEPGMDRTEVL